MTYIIIDTQATWDYWQENLMPFVVETHEEVEEMGYDELFDRWCDWMVGSMMIEGNDINYVYPYNEAAARRLAEYKIPFEVAEDDD